jgi:hypothetical protein
MRSHAFVALAIAAGSVLPWAWSQEVPASARTAKVVVDEADAITIATMNRDGMTLEELLGWWSDVTGRKFVYSEVALRQQPRIQITGTINVRKDEADALFQTMLVRAGFAMVPTSAEHANTFSIEFIQNSPSLRQTAPFLPSDKLATVRDQPARIFLTSFHLKHVRVENLRGVLTQFMTNRQSEFTAEVPASNSIVAIGFGPTLHALHQMLAAVDVPPPEGISVPKPAPKEKEGG